MQDGESVSWLTMLGLAPQLVGGGRPPGIFERRLGAVTVRRLTAASFSRASSQPVSTDTLFWTFILAGHLSVEGRGRRVVLNRELHTVRRGMGTSATRTSTGADVLSLAIPRDRITDRGLNGDNVLLPVDPLAAEARNYLLMLLSRRYSPGSPANTSLGLAAEEMLAALLMEHQGFPPDSVVVAGGLRLRSEAFIQARCTDPELCPQRVADALNVSLRSLQRAYAETDSSVSARIASHRRIRAEHLMSGLERMTFDEIAVRAGFRSVYQLRRAIIQAHGLTLRDYRQKVLEAELGPGGELGRHDPEHGTANG